MITPTGVTVVNYLAAIRNGAQTAVRLTFTEQSIELGANDVDGDGGLQLRDILNPDVDLIFGKAVAKELSIVLNRSTKTDRLRWTNEFKLECGVMVSGTMQYVTLGYFHGKRPEKTLTDNINFVSYDRMTYFDILADEFISNLQPTEQNPMSLQDIYDGLCTYVGVQNEAGDEIADIMEREFTSLPFQATGVTCREILAWIAEAVGCYARITPAGTVKMCWFTDCTASMDIPLRGCFDMDVSEIAWIYDEGLRKKWQELESDKWQELETVTWRNLEGEYSPFCVDAIRMIMTEDDVGVSVPSSGTAHNLYTIVDNPFLYGADDTETEGYLTLLLNRLKALGIYYPTSALTIGNWLIEAGDIVSVEYAPDEFRGFPIFNTGFFWNGGHESTFESTGNLERENVSLTNAQKLSLGGKFHIFRNNVNELYSQIGDRTGKSTTLSQDLDSLQLIAEGKATIYRQATDPTTDTTITVNVGDLWIDTSNNDKLWQWDGTQWVESDIIDPANHTTQSLVRVSGTGVQILTGGTFDVDSVNFKVSSADRMMQAGDWTYKNYGIFKEKTQQEDDASLFVGTGKYSDEVQESEGDEVNHVIAVPPVDPSTVYGTTYIQTHSVAIEAGFYENDEIASVSVGREDWSRATSGPDDDAITVVRPNKNTQKILRLTPSSAVLFRAIPKSSLGAPTATWDYGFIDQMFGNAETATKLKAVNLAEGSTNMLVPSNSFHLLVIMGSAATRFWLGFVYCNGSGSITRTQIGSGTGSGLTFSGGANRLEVTGGSTAWLAVLDICVGGSPITKIT